ncbi:MAG: hypothetical protein U9Q77_00765 [Candidatus Marinimicrobia bacterium]|nr:hypothetical protein [Candidatus Neomarinimicrobiota bacterium]
MSGWLIISSQQNLDITSRLGFTQQGLKKRHRKKALQIEPDDLFFYYVTGVQKLVSMVAVKSFVMEGSAQIWVNLGKNPEECYPWRFEIDPRIILDKNDWFDMSNFSKKLLHFRKWPEKNWHLGLQGQIHALRDEDTDTLTQAFIIAQNLSN